MPLLQELPILEKPLHKHPEEKKDRIKEWLRLGGTPGGHLVQTLCSSRLLTATSRCLSKDGESGGKLGRIRDDTNYISWQIREELGTGDTRYGRSMNVKLNLWSEFLHGVHQESGAQKCHGKCTWGPEVKSHRRHANTTGDWANTTTERQEAFLQFYMVGILKMKSKELCSWIVSRQGMGIRATDYSQIIYKSDFSSLVNNTLLLRSGWKCGMKRESKQGWGRSFSTFSQHIFPHIGEDNSIYKQMSWLCSTSGLLLPIFSPLKSKHLTVSSTSCTAPF